mmetsp:Transcript_38497/g.101801  ORF Transcript_38497/g.101801 Transcript_38497/m.101801 type:complete len:433 (+) Transcript_38497:191-1489(+)
MAEVSYEIPVGLPDATVLLVSAQKLAALPDVAAREDAVQTLFKLIHGVLGAPEEQKKRKLKKSNETFHRKVGRHQAAVDFLRAVGFVEGDDPEAPDPDAGKGALLWMPVAYLSRLTDAHHTLSRAAQEAGLQAPPLPGGTFNPYQSSSNMVDSTRGTKIPNGYSTEADKLREEVKKRQRELKEKVDAAPPVDMNVTAFWLSAGRRLEDVVRETGEQDARTDEDRLADNALLQSQLALAKSAMNGSNAKFESADKRRLAELRRTTVHAVCVLRVICPDKSVLQATFRAADHGEYVLAQLAPLLSEAVRQNGWYLYQSPPLKRLGPRETMAKAGFTPGANVYLGFEGGARPQAPYLEASLAATLGPAPEGNRGVNAPAGPTFSGEAMGWGSGHKLGGPASGVEKPPAGYGSFGGGHRLGGEAPPGPAAGSSGAA